METRNKREEQILREMESRGFPVSVTTTVIWAIRKAPDSAAAAQQVENLLAKGVTTKEMTRAVQPFLR